MFADLLWDATANLPVEIARWMRRALVSGWFEIEPGAYEHGGPGDAVCPIAAAAITAGIWRDGELLAGHPTWGLPDRPADEVEEFAAYFDLCAEERGIGVAIEIVRTALDAAREPGLRAA